MQFSEILTGDPAPNFKQRTTGNPSYRFDMAAGRYLVLCLFGSASRAPALQAVEAAKARPDLFDGTKAAFFGVSIDPSDEKEGRVSDAYPGYRFFWDFDQSVSRLYGAAADGAGAPYRPRWVVVSPSMRVLKVFSLDRDGANLNEIFSFIEALPPVDQHLGFNMHAPIFIIPNVLEPEICEQLIQIYESQGGVESGFMRDVGGKTVQVTDPSHKKRKDVVLEDEKVLALLQERFLRRVVPEIKKVHQFEVTRMERYIVGCYAAEDNAHFAAHRDNTTIGTAHRKFAVSVNLNADFEGGEVSFPEYGSRSFKAPVGGAVVFSCSLLHAVSAVTRGTRYAFLPFLYDDAAALLREKNSASVAGGSGYRS